MSELAEYRENLAEIEALLEGDPGNEELQTVRAELLELIEKLQAEAPPVAVAEPADKPADEPAEEPAAPAFAIGSEVVAGKFRGRVVAVTKTTYTVKSGAETREFAPSELAPAHRKARKQTAADIQLEKSKSKWQQFSSGLKKRRPARRKAYS